MTAEKKCWLALACAVPRAWHSWSDAQVRSTTSPLARARRISISISAIRWTSLPYEMRISTTCGRHAKRLASMAWRCRMHPKLLFLPCHYTLLLIDRDYIQLYIYKDTTRRRKGEKKNSRQQTRIRCSMSTKKKREKYRGGRA